MDRDPFHFDYAGIEAQIAHARAERAAILGDMIGRLTVAAVRGVKTLVLRTTKSLTAWSTPPRDPVRSALPHR